MVNLQMKKLKNAKKNEKLDLKLNTLKYQCLKLKQKVQSIHPYLKELTNQMEFTWLIKHYPNLPDSKICKIIGTTKKTVQSIRDRTYWNIQGLRAQNPQELGLCSREELQKIIDQYNKNQMVKQ